MIRYGVVALAAVWLMIATVEAKDKVKVGFIGPLTGGVSVNGLGGRNSADLAVKLRNADPRAKYEYELMVLDDACTPNVAVQVATKMSADKDVIAAATHYCSSTAIATVDVYHKFGLPVVVWGAVLPDITYRNKYAEIHRVNGTMINQNDANAELIAKLGYKTVAVIHDTTDYGKGHNQYFSAALTKLGGKIVGTFGVTADQQDFTAELTQIKALNPEVIYFGGLTPIGVRIRSQMDKLGIKAVFDGTSGIVSDAFIQGLGPLAEGVLAFREGAPTEKLPGGKFFMEKYAAQKYDNPPEAYGAFAYAAMALILDSIEKVGPDRKKVIAELANVKDRDSIVGKITFDDHGQNTVPVITKYVIQDGKFVEWADSDYASGKRKLPGKKSFRRRQDGETALPPTPSPRAGHLDMDAGLLAQYIMNGLMLGMMYALVAVGFTLFFGVLDIIKFSHGDVLTVGAFTALAAYVGLQSIDINSSPVILLVMLLVAIFAMAALGMIIARMLVLPLRSAPALNTLLITLMLGTVLRESVRLFYPQGANPKPFPALLPSVSVNFGNLNLRLDNVLMLAAGALVIVGLQLLLNRTKLGLAVRAVAQDEETARIMGINFTAIVLITFAIGSGLAAFAGIMNGLYYNEINFSMGLYLGVIGFAAAIIGGLGSIYGAILGGFLFAALQTIGTVALPFASAYKDVFAFTVVIFFMAWRPTGLIPEKISERV